MINEAFERTAARHTAEIALLDAGECLTYGELASRKRAVARHLAEDLAVSPGDIVAVCLPNCWEFVTAFFAAAEIGAVLMPYNTAWRSRETEWFARRFPPAAVVTTEGLLEVWDRLPAPALKAPVVKVDDPETGRLFRTGFGTSSLQRHEREALCLTTSGSSGRPKVVPRTHRALLAGAENVAHALGVRSGQRFLSVVPFYHANGFANCMFLPLIAGATAVLMNRFTPGKLTQVVRERRINVLIASPFIFSLLADLDPGASDFSTVETCLSSGAAMPAGLAERCAERLGLDVRELYGSSETGTISIQAAGGSRDRGNVGPPLRTVEVRIGEAGEIEVRSPAMMPGYLEEPEINAKAFRDGFFRTGDLGRINSRGEIIVSGRSKRMINVAGIKVDPAEIENTLEEMPAIRHCRAMAVRDHRQLEIIKVALVVKPGGEPSRGAIIAHCRRRLAEHKIPRVIEFVDAIPATLAGKSPAAWAAEENDVPAT